MVNGSQKRRYPKGWSTSFPLPTNTTSFVNRHWNSLHNQNLGLWLDRFTTWRDWDDKGRDISLEPDPSSRRRQSAILAEADGLLQWQGDLDLLKGLTSRWSQMLISYSYRDAFTASPAWRFVVGLGGAHVLETGMTLHRLYGIPIIPGSTLKGLARAYAEEVKGKGSDDPDIVAIFGKPPLSTPLETGEIIFFDAIPVSRPKFKLDVMTPHFPQYYQGNKPPADWQNPNPIYFLTVTNTIFLFAVAARRKEGKEYVKTALEWLKEGLAELGVGAKTAAGYGYFKDMDFKEKG
ncbi:MAG: type III-B CRISPR module RAMP protein Cmr6 [Candidatus Diapherotrites archaeon]|nr:type III-B CRISPR module RAMP protein Cmr6 [Candidatus Diapherotrites archaeon]